MKKFFLFIFITFISTSIIAQVKSIGTPFIRNYARANYQGGSQTWEIKQGENGMMYFANNNGLLEFDGQYWEIYSLPNNSIMRSIAVANDSIIYGGGFNEFGYYKIGAMGRANYFSLVKLLPSDMRNFGDVWKIFIHPDGIIFQTYTQLMFLKDDEITVIKAPSTFHFSFLVDNEYYVNDIEKGLLRYAMGSLYPLIGCEYLKGKELWGILSIGNNLLISTASEGNFIYDGNSLKPWENKSNDFLKQNQIYCSLHLEDQLFAFGTIQNGLLICDPNGIPVQHINMKDGLQNNTVLCIGIDKMSNLWIGTDHGIDYININSPLSQMSYNYGLGAGYTSLIFKGNLYLGTNQGLFIRDLTSVSAGGIEPKEMNLIEETRGQVWTLSDINGDLFCGHNNGTFLIKGEKAEKISDVPGGWTYLQIPDDSSKIVGGTYTGLVIYQRDKGKWKYSKKVNGFTESSRILVFDEDGSLWIAHGYKGVFHLYFNKNYDSVLKVNLYNNQNSVFKSSDVDISKIENEIVFFDSEHIYHFSKKRNTFEHNMKFQNLFKNMGVRSVEQDDEGNIWYFSNNQTGVFRVREDGDYTNITLPFKQLEGRFNYSFELVYPIDDHNVIFGVENGFVHYDPSVIKNYNYSFRAYLRKMRSFNPDSVYFSTIRQENEIELDYSNNDLEFIFSANDFENPNQVMFSTFMQGYDEEWSDWQPRTSRDFTNLNEGDYIFKVRAKNIYGKVTEEIRIGFSVLPPFERSLIAFILYGLAIVVALLLVGLIFKRRFELAKIRNQKEQEEIFRRREEKLQKEASESEKQVIRLRNEKLREEMKLKDKELANATMQTLHKNEMLIKLRDELKKLAALSTDETHKYKVKYLVRKINKEIDNENQWKIFETQFESVHEEFLKRLKITYPDLTPRELKLCAYLRMNNSSKEISLLMNISTRGVEISRYRLRKKLDLSRETNLTDFIMSF
jgi:ligand-binding sensor domain-containing protein/DNA-binding CsgD family transcriptional regulator